MFANTIENIQTFLVGDPVRVINPEVLDRGNLRYRSDGKMTAEAGVVSVRGLVVQPRGLLSGRSRGATAGDADGDVHHSRPRRIVTYKGPTLLDVIKAAGGVVEEQRLDRLRTYVIARSASGYEVVFSWERSTISLATGSSSWHTIATTHPARESRASSPPTITTADVMSAS
jgi:hypothetical protein